MHLLLCQLPLALVGGVAHARKVCRTIIIPELGREDDVFELLAAGELSGGGGG